MSKIDDLPISSINDNSPSFNFLELEPDIYSIADIIVREVTPGQPNL